MGLFTNIWMGLKWLFKLIATPLAKIKPGGGRVVGQVVRWGLHALFVIGILVGLAILNYQLDLQKLLRVPWPVLGKTWLPLLFSLVYLLAWLGAGYGICCAQSRSRPPFRTSTAPGRKQPTR